MTNTPMRRVRLCTLAVAGCVIAACGPTNLVGTQGRATSPPEAHTSRNSVDWAGVYEGVMPCADCPRTATRLALQDDESYVLTTWPLTRPDPPATVRSRFTWLPSGNAIALDAVAGERRWRVGEGRLLPATRDGAPDAALVAGALTQLPLGAPADAASGWASYRWQLEEAMNAVNQPIGAAPPGATRKPVLSLADGRITVDGNCNLLNGGYRVEANGQLIVGRLASTMRACQPALMQADTALSNLLAKPLRADIIRGAQAYLRLVSDANETLLFSGDLTPDARYGAPTIMFLEIAPDRVPCSQPPMSASKCLSVRERRYDAQGLPVGAPGAWHPMYEAIEGFTHRDGERNVLRVRRYARDRVPADASAYVYVLELVVEAEIVSR